MNQTQNQAPNLNHHQPSASHQHQHHQAQAQAQTHPSTTPSSNPNPHITLSSATPPIHLHATYCPQCRLPQNRFYCKKCLNDRLLSHSDDLQRVGKAAKEAAQSVKTLLGPLQCQHEEASTGMDKTSLNNQHVQDESGEEEIQDPFGQVDEETQEIEPQIGGASPESQPQPPYFTSHHYRISRAIHDSLSAKLSEVNLALQSTQSSTRTLQHDIRRRNQLLDQRRQNLRTASSLGLSGKPVEKSREESSVDPSSTGREQVSKSSSSSPVRNSLARAFSNPFSLNNYMYYDHQFQYLEEAVEEEAVVGNREAETQNQEPQTAKEVDQETNPSLFDQVERLKRRKIELEKEDKELWKELVRIRSSKVRTLFKIFKISSDVSKFKDRAGYKEASSIQEAAFVRARNHPNDLKNRSSTPESFKVAESKGKNSVGSYFSPFGLSSISGLTNGSFSKSIPISHAQPTSPVSSLNPPSAARGGDDSESNRKENLTINDLQLPLPTMKSLKDLTRKEEINAAILYTLMVLELTSGYLGIELPFSAGCERDGKPWIERNWFWNSTWSNLNQCISSRENKRTSPKEKVHSLHLTSTNFNQISSFNLERGTSDGNGVTGGGMMGNLGASTLSLGASTLSGLESFIQLPGRDHFTWGRASVMNANPKETQREIDHKEKVLTGNIGNLDDKGSTQAGADDSSIVGSSSSPTSNPNLSSHSSSSSSSSSNEKSLNSFLTAVTMLNYDVLYLAKTQGVALDFRKLENLNMLEVLRMVLQGRQLGMRSWLGPDLDIESALEPDTLLEKDLDKAKDADPSSGKKTSKTKSPSFPSSTLIKDLEFEELDFDSLLSIYDPKNQFQARASARIQRERQREREKSKEKEKEKASGSNANTAMDESYVDAGKAAESVLLISQKQEERNRQKVRERQREKEKMLREKERRSSKSSDFNPSNLHQNPSARSGFEESKRRSSNLNPSSNVPLSKIGSNRTQDPSSNSRIRPSPAANARLSTAPISSSIQTKPHLDFLRNKGRQVAEKNLASKEGRVDPKAVGKSVKETTSETPTTASNPVKSMESSPSTSRPDKDRKFQVQDSSTKRSNFFSESSSTKFDSQKPSSSSSYSSSKNNTPAKINRSDGAVIFNGIEIRGKDELLNEGKVRKNGRKKEGEKVDEEDWDVL